MAYLYAAMWLLVGLILIFRMGKENGVFYPVGAYFLFLGAWWAANEVSPENLFTGVWGWILRAVTACALVFACIVFFKGIKKAREAFRNGNGGEKH